MKHLGDICKISGRDAPTVNVIIGGSPCQDLSVAGKRAGLSGERSGLFMEQIRIIKEMREKDAESGRTGNEVRPRFMVWENVCFDGETLITTESGFKPIKDIQEGEQVLTHTGKFRPVVKVHKSENQPCIEVKAGGIRTICTANHPFLAIRAIKNETSIIGWSEPEFVRACDLTLDHRLVSICDSQTLSDDYISDADAWALGRWIADGSVDLKRSNPRIFISCGDYKIDYARKMLGQLDESVYENRPHKSCTNFVFTSKRFYEIIKSCGRGAHNKVIPDFVFKMSAAKQALVLDGYMSGDGNIRCRRKNTQELHAGSVSKNLIFGIARLVRNVYGVPASTYIRPKRDGIIEGRVIHSNYPFWCVDATISNRNMTNRIGQYIKHRITEIRQHESNVDVYNLSVLEDNTYVANGFVVHNCGSYSSNGGRDFAAILEETIRVAEPDAPDIHVPKGGWTNSGCIMGRQWSVAWRVLDAQFFGVPQRRRRIALVADFAGGGSSGNTI